MKHSNNASSNQITNKMYVNLYVFSALVLNWVRGHVNRANIVTVDNHGFGGRTPKLTKQVRNPTRLNNSVGDAAILCLNTRLRDNPLSFGGP